MVPRFSVVIPIYNRAALVGTCLAPLLEPAAEGLDVIVVDDGSTDGTGEAVARLAATSRGARIRLVSQANAGASAARNRGVAEAEGEWIAFLDSDDIWLPWAVGLIEQALQAADAASLVFWRVESFRDPATLPTVQPGAARFETAESYLDFYARRLLPIYGSCNVAVRRAHFAEVGGFDTAIRSAEDQDLFLRLSRLGRVLAVLAPPLMGNHSGSVDSLSRSYAAVADGIIRILGKRRAGAYDGPADLLDYQAATMAKVAFWHMMDGGDRASALRLLRACGGLVARVSGIRYAASMWAALVRSRA